MSSLPDPFGLPETLNLSQDELSALRDFTRTDTWTRVVSKLFDDYYSKLTWDLYNARDNHAHIQGAVRAVSQLKHIITHPESYFVTKPVSSEEELQEKWTKHNQSEY